MKILLLTLYYLPDTGPDPALMAGLANEWIRKGHHVTVISSFPHYKQQRLRPEHRWKIFDVERKDHYRVIRCRVFVPSHQNFWPRILNYFSFMIASFIAAMCSGKFDTTVVYSPPPSNGVVAYLVKFFRGTPYILNVQDIYPEAGVRLRVFKNKYLIRFIDRFDTFIAAHASRIAAITEGLSKRYIGRGIPAERISVIPNWADASFIRPMPDIYKSEFGIPEKFIFLYSGNIGLSQGLELVLEAAQVMDGGPRRICFAIFGEGEGYERLKTRARNAGLTNVMFHERVKRERFPALLASAAVSLVVLKKGLSFTSAPSKVYSIMASARPILAAVDEGSDTEKLISDSGCGLCVPPDDVQSFVNACCALYDHRASLQDFGKNGRAYLEHRISCERSAGKYLELISGITTKREKHSRAFVAPVRDRSTHASI
jgi:colanic acid biosynthesis glycosyl transferase WcaI